MTIRALLPPPKKPHLYNLSAYQPLFLALSQALSGYQLRSGQLQLTEAIAENMRNKGVLLAEAGTGTGKTLSYLLPALYEGKKTLISTATKALQEQIYLKDIPVVENIFPDFKVGILKGRRNYLCHYYYHDTNDNGRLNNQAEVADFKKVQAFFTQTKDGDLANLKGVAEDSPILDKITSNAENCLRSGCPFFKECFLQNARYRVNEADLIIVNHHLLLADLALKDEGFAEILPNVEAFIIDEAHHLPQIGSRFLGTKISAHQLKLLATQCKELYAHFAHLVSSADRIFNLADTLPSKIEQKNQTISEQALVAEKRFWADLDLIADELNYLSNETDASDFLEQALQSQLLPDEEEEKLFARRLSRMNGRIKEVFNQINHLKNILKDPKPQEALWLENQNRGFSLNSQPSDISQTFQSWVANSQASWHFLSATLATDGHFQHFANSLGLSAYSALILDSPFDYRKQMVLYHPHQLPQPNAPEYTSALIEAVRPILELTNGRAFLLFTSYSAMNEAHERLKSSDFQLFVQGSMGKNELLNAFRTTPKALLLATASFWEGVDVRGDRLVCVVIDKLPFVSPAEPLTKLRHRLMQEKGLSPFMEDTLPQAIISLKQGVGRLIRDASDYGVLVIGDPRLAQKNYGTTFLNSLPRMTRTQDLNIVKRFFDHHEPKTL